MRKLVITGLWGPAMENLGWPFLTSFNNHWPDDVDLMVYTDHPSFNHPRCRRRLLSEVTGLVEWRAGIEDDVIARGKVEGPPPARWRDKERRQQYSWRHDTYKWSPQGIVPNDAANFLKDGDILVWLDADVVTHIDIPEKFLDRMLDGKDLAYLGRPNKHSEIGFYAVRISPTTKQMLLYFRDLYVHNGWRNLPETHSAYCFDVMRQKFEGRFAERLINTPGTTGHVWFQSPLGDYMDHQKGARKGRGSAEARRKGWGK